MTNETQDYRELVEISVLSEEKYEAGSNLKLKRKIHEIGSESTNYQEKCTRKIGIRLIELIFITLIPIIALSILTNNQNPNDRYTLSFFLGITIEIMYICYFSLIGYLFYSGSRISQNRSLFRIWTRSAPSFVFFVYR